MCIGFGMNMTANGAIHQLGTDIYKVKGDACK